MDDLPLHRFFRHYSELPYSQRVLYTATLLVLGLGYVFALLNVYFTYAGRAGGNPLMLSYEDIVVAYSGSGKGSRLESALRGPMSTMLPPDERAILIAWSQEGAAPTSYEREVKPVLEVNTGHALVKRLEADDAHFDDLAHILFDQALLAEGGLPEDPAAYVRRVNALLA